MFLSNVLIDGYNASLQDAMCDQNIPIDNKANIVGSLKINGKRNFLVEGDLSADEDIRGLELEEVLNVNHLLGDEKLLVAQVKFRNIPAIKYIRATWVHERFPQMIIAFYESHRVMLR